MHMNKKSKCFLQKWWHLRNFENTWVFYHNNLNVSDKSGKTTFGLALKSIWTDNFFEGEIVTSWFFFLEEKNISVHIFAVIISIFNIKRTNFNHNRSKILNNPFSTVLFPPEELLVPTSAQDLYGVLLPGRARCQQSVEARKSFLLRARKLTFSSVHEVAYSCILSCAIVIRFETHDDGYGGRRYKQEIMSFGL